jgi:hypothetical protein
MRPNVNRLRSLHSRNVSTSDQTEAAGSACRIGWNRKSPDESIERAHQPRSHEAVVATGAGAPHDVVALAPSRDKGRQQVRRILQVGRHDDRRVAKAVIDAGGDRDVAAEVPRKPEAAHAGIAFSQVPQHLERTIAAAVVDEDELPGEAADAAQHRGHFVVEPLQVRFLVVNRDHDRQEIQRSRHVPATSSMTAAMTRDWSSSVSAANIGRRIVVAETSSVTGSTAGPKRSTYNGS